MVKQEMFKLMSNTQKNVEDMIRVHAEGHDGCINMTDHFDTWATNKEHIFRLFGNKLKIEKEVEASLTKDDINEKLQEFFETKVTSPKLLLVKLFLRSIPILDLAKNSLTDGHVFLDKKFGAGMKISRIFKQIVPKEFLEQLQTDFSMLIQDLKVKGTLVLSIDPIDYLTMSENDGGWRSCHNIFDGEYKVGTLSYMQDKATIIAYVRTSDIKKGDCTFGKKVWRQCIYLSPTHNGFVHSRSYPNSNKSNRTTATNMLKDILNANAPKDLFTINEGVKFEEGFHSVGEIDYNGWVYDAGGSLHYNDIRHEGISQAYVVKIEDTPELSIEIGSEVYCISGQGALLHDAEALDADCQSYDW